MANTPRNSYTKTIKVKADFDVSNIKKSMKNYETSVRNIFNTFAEEFEQSTFGRISDRLKKVKLKNLLFQKSELDKEKAALKSSEEYYAYDKDQKKYEKLYEQYKKGELTDDILKEVSSMFEILERLEEIGEQQTELQEQINEASKKEDVLTKGLEFSAKVAQSASEKLDTTIQEFPEKLKSVIEEGLKEYKNISSYSLDTSLKINQTARDQALTYGLSNAQNYALTKAMEDLGATDIEDLYWMTPSQQERFSERIGYWTGQYEKIANIDNLKTFEELQRDLEDMKSELQMYVVSFIADNKDLIVWSLKTGISLLTILCDSITTISGWLGFREKTSESIVSDTINNYATNKNSTTTVNIDNSFTGISTENVAKLKRYGQEVSNQMITALRGSV